MQGGRKPGAERGDGKLREVGGGGRWGEKLLRAIGALQLSVRNIAFGCGREQLKHVRKAN